MSRYRIDSEHSSFRVQAFAAGVLSFVGHSPTFAVRNFTGTVEFVDDLIARMQLALTVPAAELSVIDNMKLTDRREIEDRMRDEVLDTAVFSAVTFRAAATATEKRDLGRYRSTLEGALAVRGVSRPHRLEVELGVFTDGLRARGTTEVRMSDYGIGPVTALAGAIRLKDEVKLTFDIVAVPEGA